MKRFIIMAMLVTLSLLTACATPLKMGPAPLVDAPDLTVQPLTAGLFIPATLRDYIHEVVTSPVDKMAYPIGAQTAELFEKNLPLVFAQVVAVDNVQKTGNVDLVIEPQIVKFKPEVPVPAYNPYTATIVYRVDVFDKAGQKAMTLTAAGEAQSSKGLMSGFSARSICAEVAQQAMADAMQQILEGLATADELKSALARQ
jgi:hypothetical protein